MEIPDKFGGYVEFRENTYFFSVDEDKVKIFPQTPRENLDIFRPDGLQLPTNKHFMMGFDETNHDIALMISSSRIESNSVHAWFGTALIIKATEDAVDGGIETFDAIDFHGGIVNSVYNPKKALDTSSLPNANTLDGSQTIKIKPLNEYTHKYEIELAGEKAQLMYSVADDGKTFGFGNNSLGALNSFVRISFEKEQHIETLPDFYVAIQNFLSFLVGRHNHVGFDVYLKQRTGDGKYRNSAVCKFSRRKYVNTATNIVRVIPLDLFGDKLNAALSIFGKGNAVHIDAILPKKTTNRISFDDVRNLCVALEVEYDKHGFNEKTYGSEDELKKELKKAIKEFRTAAEENAEAAEKAFSLLTGFGLSLTDKIWFLYERYKKHIFGTFQSDTITRNDIRKVVKVRDSISHTNSAEWFENTDIYIPLHRIVFCSVLERIGLDDETISNAVKRIL